MPDSYNVQLDCEAEDGDNREKSWAQRLGNIETKKNVLEVILEKDSKGAFNVTDVECARFLAKLGLDLRPGIHVEGMQVCPNGRGIILIILKDTVKAENFCRYDVPQVTESGIRSVMVNTNDSHIINYLKKFWAVPQVRVMNGMYKEGPLKGMFNGDRHFNPN